MKVSIVQLEIKDNETRQQRIERADALLERIEETDLVVFPENWPTGYFSFDKYEEEAEPIDGPFVEHYAQKAKEMNTHIFAGSFVERDGDNLYNTSVLFNPEGELIGTYRKIHLFRYGSKEGELLSRGLEPTVVDTPFGKVGLTTCYDIRFPELYRAQVDMGAEIFLVTAAWPLSRVKHWNTFNAARALENQCFLISCNCVGETQGEILGGHSQIVDPWGMVQATLDASEAVLTAEIDLSQIERVREDFPQLKHRVMGG